MRSGRPNFAVGSLWEGDCIDHIYVRTGSVMLWLNTHTHPHPPPESPCGLKYKGLFLIGSGWQRSLLSEVLADTAATISDVARERYWCLEALCNQPVQGLARSHRLHLVPRCLPSHKGARKVLLPLCPWRFRPVPSHRAPTSVPMTAPSCS